MSSAPASTGAGGRGRSASLQLTGRETLLDVCTGTADVALEARRIGERRAARVRRRRLRRRDAAARRTEGPGRGRGGRIALVRGDAMRLPVPRRQSADAATVAFGIRNVQRPDVACAEMARALRPGGRLAILEFGVPRFPALSTLYLWYFRHLLPLVGRIVSGHGAAYSYLPASVGTFPPPADS